jgi:hypothetical protein
MTDLTIEQMQMICRLAPRRYPEYESILMANDDTLVDYITMLYTHTTAVLQALLTKESLVENMEFALYYYAHNIMHGRWPEAEARIATSPQYAYYYALGVIGGRWAPAEELLSTMGISHARWAYYYANEILHQPWPEAEHVISTECVWWRRYASRFELDPTKCQPPTR